LDNDKNELEDIESKQKNGCDNIFNDSNINLDINDNESINSNINQSSILENKLEYYKNKKNIDRNDKLDI